MTVNRTFGNSGKSHVHKPGNPKLRPIALGLLLALCPLTVLAKQSTPEQLYPALTAEVLPELAATGKHAVGVKTVQVTDPARFDPLTQAPKARKLTLEIWYPAAIDPAKPLTSYENQSRSGVPFSLKASAVRDVPVLGLTANVNPLDLAAFKSAGLSDVMLKPFEPAVLCSKIEQCLLGGSSTSGL